MNARTLLVILAASLGTSALCDPAVIETEVNPANNRTYHLLSSSTWAEAQAAAEALDGDLVTIDDLAENTWVYNTFGDLSGTPRNLWIGLNDIEIEGAFVWAGGSSFGFGRWSPGEPTAHFDDEDYVYMITNGVGGQNSYWNNHAAEGGSAAPLYGVVEIEGPPACNPADLAAPLGLLDLADVTAFASGFLSMSFIADLNADGLFDLGDINLFVTSFLAGCP